MAPRPQIRDLLPTLPLPLAQIAKRALNARPGPERHLSAFYLAEATLKLAASARIALWVSRVADPRGELGQRLEGLALPSLGHWCSFLRDVERAIAGLPGAADLPVGAKPDELSRRRSWTAVLELARQAAAASIVTPEQVKAAERQGALGFFDLLVTYRNDVVGHGALRGQAFYEQFSALLLDALAEVLSLAPLLGGLELAVARMDVAPSGRGATITWKGLTGLGGLPLDEPAEGAAAGQLYLLKGSLAVPLHPLVVYREDDHGNEHFGFLNRAVRDAKKGAAKEVRRAEYLDYATGESLPDVDACEALTTLLSKLRKKATTVHDVGTIADRLDRESSQPGGETPAPLSARSEAADRTGQIIAGKYRLTGVLGRGGMGTVYDARHVKLPRRYAVKMLLPGLAARADLVERFEREAEQAAAIEHPGIVDVIDFGRAEDGSLYLVMERLAGQGLDAIIEAGQIPVARAVALARSALEALDAAHERSLVHRDLKPENLFVTCEKDGTERVKVLDFGIAKVLAGARSMTQEGGVLGTPSYMSPEQLRGLATIDRRADIYSMGATLYQMLTGVPPVDGDSLLDIGAKVLAGEVERSPRRLRSDVPDWLDEVVVRAMAAKPADRFQGAVEMREALVTPTAPPPPPRARAPDAAGAPHGHHASSLEPYTPHAPFAPAPPPRASHARDVPLPGAPSPGPFYDAWNAARAPALAEDPIVEPPAPVGTQITAAIPVVHAPASSSDTLPAFEPTVPASEAATPEPLVAVSALETGLPAGPEFSPRGDDAAYPSEPPAPPRPAQARSKLRAVGVIALAVVLIPFGLVVLLGVLALLAFPRLGATQYTVSASASAAPSGGDAVAASAATAVNAATGAPFG